MRVRGRASGRRAQRPGVAAGRARGARAPSPLSARYLHVGCCRAVMSGFRSLIEAERSTEESDPKMGDCPRAVRACRFRRLPPHRTERRRRHLGRQGQRRDARPNARAPRRRGRRRQVAARRAARGQRLARACAAYIFRPAPSQSFSQARTVQLCYLPGRPRRARSFTTTTTITTHTTATTTSSLVFERAPPSTSTGRRS